MVAFFKSSAPESGPSRTMELPHRQVEQTLLVALFVCLDGVAERIESWADISDALLGGCRSANYRPTPVWSTLTAGGFSKQRFLLEASSSFCDSDGIALLAPHRPPEVPGPAIAAVRYYEKPLAVDSWVSSTRCLMAGTSQGPGR